MAVGKTSIGYSLLQVIVDKSLDIFFRYRITEYTHPIPQGKPIIFCPTHQNSFLDALMVVCATSHQPYSLARADVFGKPLLAAVLRGMRIAPIYRIKDGYDTLQKNDQVFGACYDILKQNDRIIIFPEGSHGDVKRLRKLKTGAARIALGAIESGVEDVLIVPVGIEFSDKYSFRSNVFTLFGEPISAKQYVNDSSGTRLLTQQIADGIKKISVHIEEEESQVLAYFDERYPINGDISIQEYISNQKNRIEESKSTFNVNVTSSNKSINKYRTKFNPFRYFFILPESFLHWLLKIIKDDQFIGSLKIVAIAIIFPLYIFLTMLILTILSWKASFTFGVLSIVMGIGWVFWKDSFNRNNYK